MRAEHERRVVDDLRDLNLFLETRREEEGQGTYASFMPRNPLVNSAVSSIKSRGRGLL